MSDRSSLGSTPCEYRFIAIVTMSMLPVRSPLPSNVPSTRSAPAITPSSAAATPQPRSLCVCTLTRTCSRCCDVIAHPLDHVGVDVGRAHLDRRRQVDDHVLALLGLPHADHRVDDLGGEVELGAGEALRANTRTTTRSRAAALRHCLHPARALHGDVADAGTVELEHVLALHGRGRVVQVHDRRARAPLQRLVSCARSALRVPASAPGS